jgi:two-component system cell cycle response regulator
VAGFFHDRHSGIVTAYKDVRTYLDYIHKAETGPLTGLNNRGYLDKRLSREIDNAHKHAIPLSIAILDADDFGRINKIYDYPTGDAALRVIADVLRQETRTTDWVARYGGEGFCVVMPSTSLNDGVIVLERFRQAISERSVPTSKDEPLRVTVSSGAIELAKGESELDELYTRASDALQFAKNEGKNRIAYQDSALSDAIRIFGDN